MPIFSLVVMMLCLCAACAVSATSVAWSRTPTLQMAPTQVLSDLKRAIVTATGYRVDEVELHVRQRQLVIVLVNSQLAIVSPDFFRAFAAKREVEAAHIASTVTSVITSTPQLGAVLSLRVDYVERRKSGRMRVLDSIEFRKDPQGQFLHHTT